ncbi:hypothetical protein [Streptomyces albofaciens]|uniref:hypothetical protein n=1 Tax=Streptomyces albofaciens TaxID=66866 RepID=UPI001FCABC00|nr:hypothetical protein [Streptomyces albofaciens]
MPPTAPAAQQPQPPFQQPQPPFQQPQPQPPLQQQPASAMPLPPQAPPPVPNQAQPVGGAPSPDMEATALIPPFDARTDGPAGAPMPPAAGDPEATALLRPVGGQSGRTGGNGQPGQPGRPGPMPGAAPLPPEAGAGRPESPAESTRKLRPVKPGGPQHPQSARPDPDSEATQFIPPVGAGSPAPPPGAPFAARPGAPGERATPAEFDGLFRSGPAGAAPAAGNIPDATAPLPRFDDAEQPGPHRQQYDRFPPQPGPGADGGGKRRRLAPAVIIGVSVVALAGAGLGVGWALSGGGEDGSAKSKQESGGASGAEKGDKAGRGDQGAKEQSPSADPVAAQAKELDALLKDSNNSRSAVIGAVNSIKSCDNLDGAADDLRGAAAQRNELVSRLSKLTVDKLPGSADLTASLNEAWKSSAAADNHYAAWAGRVKGEKGCPKGKARGGKEAAQGNAASGRATKAKQQAAKLWNPIAQKYGLTERRPEQL